MSKDKLPRTNRKERRICLQYCIRIPYRDQFKIGKYSLMYSSREQSTFVRFNETDTAYMFEQLHFMVPRDTTIEALEKWMLLL